MYLLFVCVCVHRVCVSVHAAILFHFFLCAISLYNFTILFNFHRPPPSQPFGSLLCSLRVLFRFSSFLHQFFSTRFVMIPHSFECFCALVRGMSSTERLDVRKRERERRVCLSLYIVVWSAGELNESIRELE